MRYVSWFIEHLIVIVTVVLVLQGLVVIYGFWDVLPDVKKVLAHQRRSRNAATQKESTEDLLSQFREVMSSSRRENMEELVEEMELRQEIAIKLQDLHAGELEEIGRKIDALRGRTEAFGNG